MLYYSLLGFLWAFFVSVFAIPSIIHLAHLKKILDEPNTRTIHEMLTPRLGGLAIFAGFSSALTVFGDISTIDIQKTFAGAVIIFFIGLKDDIAAVSPFKKFFVQVLATGIVMFMGNVTITNFYGILGIYELDQGISYFFTFIVIVGITNAINLIDGVNGLAGTIILIASCTFGIYFLKNENVFCYVAFCLMGGILGFLRYNFNKAIIFMGDTGSLVCGFILAVMAVKLVELEPVLDNTPSMAIAALFIPIIDTLRVFILRVLVGASPFSPDKNHLHHRLLSLGLSHTLTVLVLAAVNIVAILFVVFFRELDDTVLIACLFGYGVVFSVVLELLNKKGLSDESEI